MIVTLGNTKGGVGKTTLAVQLALARARAGGDVLLVDDDRRGSAVQRQAGKYDHVVIDAGGRDSTALRAALALSDLLVVPFLPRSVDVWALADIAALVDEANSLRNGLSACAVLNAADPGASSDNADAASALTDFLQLVLLDCPIRRRKAFANAVGLGLSVEELAALVSMVSTNQMHIKISGSQIK